MPPIPKPDLSACRIDTTSIKLIPDTKEKQELRAKTRAGQVFESRVKHEQLVKPRSKTTEQKILRLKKMKQFLENRKAECNRPEDLRKFNHIHGDCYALGFAILELEKIYGRVYEMPKPAKGNPDEESSAKEKPREEGSQESQ